MQPFPKRGSISPGDLEIQHKVKISIRQMHTTINNLAKTLSSNLCFVKNVPNLLTLTRKYKKA